MLHPLFKRERGAKSSMNLENQEYYIGLDCGTSSVGWAVTDLHYNLLRFHGKDMWGSHLFDEAQTAESRRLQRNARKRLGRRRERLNLLQDIFAEEIAKVDPTFFLRLNESCLHPEDRSAENRQPFSLFNDADFTDADYYRLFPTIYHLRMALIDGKAPEDPRLVYLALHNILKNRGHFLFQGKDISNVMSLAEVFDVLNDAYYEIYEEELHYTRSYEEIEELIQDKTVKTRDKINILDEVIYTGNTSKYKKALLQAMFGYKVTLSKLFPDAIECDVESIELRKASFEEEDLPVLEDSLTDDQFRLIEVVKQVFDWALLAGIMKGSERGYISEAKVAQYKSNHRDLATLKTLVRKYKPDEFNHFFYGVDKSKGLFSHYIGAINTASRKLDGKEAVVQRRVPRANTDAFYKEVKAILKGMPADDPDVIMIQDKMEADDFLPLLRSFRNGVVPYQVNKTEMEAILRSASPWMPWLNVKDDDGFTPAEKIISILEYRIPYYVGPLTDPKYNANAWIVRRKEGKILPWNFREMVDEEASDKQFIKRMTNKCTYLIGEDVLPASSLLYQKYLVLNEINTIKINNVPITVEQKQAIYNDLYKNSRKTVTTAGIKKYAISQGWVDKSEEINVTGIDVNAKSKLSSYHIFKNYDLKRSEKEWIINALTLHSDGGRIVEGMLRKELSDKLSDSQIKAISRMKFSGWGALSEKFLAGILSDEDENGECSSIISLLWKTNLNLMQILNDRRYGFLDKIEDREPIASLDYSVLENERISPKVKRQIWQAMKIVKEIQGVMKHAPKKVFIEVARYNRDDMKGNRTTSRKDTLLGIFKSDRELRKVYSEVYDSLDKQESSMITKRDRLYLYYTQLGRCMYSGEPIDLDDLLSGHGEKYDIDHIYPFSKSNDDSLTNKVLVKAQLNREKTNEYPIRDNIRHDMAGFWKTLKDKTLINEEKYNRLVRATALSSSDYEGFINRQLVETSQSTKALANILKRYYGDDTQVVYSKAGNVSDFRQKFEIYKARSVNHLHHAKDAYLNIVVGNILNTRYSSDWFRKNVNFNRPYEAPIDNVWIPGETIKHVKQTCFKNSVLFTRQPEMRTGQLFDLNLVAKGSKNGLLPAKMSDPKLQALLAEAEDKNAVIKAWTDRYGGYNAKANSHFALIKRKDKKNTVYEFVPIPIVWSKSLVDGAALIDYCQQELGYEEVEVIRPVVMINSSLIVNGYRFTLTGYTSGYITLESSQPLLLENDDMYYIKKLERFAAFKKDNKYALVDSIFDEISVDRNIEMYHVLREKAHEHCYHSRPSSQVKIFDSGLDLFTDLTVEDQVEALLQMISYFGMTNGMANLTLLNGSAHAGKLLVSAKFQKDKTSMVLVDSSITGLYEKRMKL